MKTLLLSLLALTLSVGASAQKKTTAPRTRMPRIHSRVYIVPSVSLYGGWGWGWGFPYGYYGYPFGYFNYPYYSPYAYRSPRAAALNNQIDAIKSQYKFKIKAVRKDKALDKAQKKQEILSLKSQRESDIANAQYEFYHPKANKPIKQNNNSEDQTNNNNLSS